MKELTLENVQVDCRELTEEQIDEMLSVVDDKLDPLNSSFDLDKGCIYFSFNKYCKLFGFYGFDEEQYEITYEKFMELFGNKEKTEDFNLRGYSVEVDNEEQAKQLQEYAFKQGFTWEFHCKGLKYLNAKYFTFRRRNIYHNAHHANDLKQIHFNDIFAPKYEVTMIAEKPKHPLPPVIEKAMEVSENINKVKAYKEKANKLNYELDFNFITQLAERMNANKGKYEPYNWQRLDNIEDLKQALFRHVMEVMKGNYEDDTRPYGHLEAIALNCMFINYQLNGK